MKLLDFANKNYGWPFSADTFQFIQEQMQQLQMLGFIGGNTYIVQGCTDNGAGVIGNGWVSIAGEILPFVGGAVQTNVVIVPTATTASFGDPATGATPQFYDYTIDRIATFGSAGTLYPWANFENKGYANGLFKRLKDAENAIATIDNNLTALTIAFNLYEPDWADITNKPAGIHYATSYNLPQNGNIGGGAGNPTWPNAVSNNDSIYTISFPALLNTNYIVTGSLYCYEGDANFSNDVAWVVADKQVGSFKLAVRELAEVEQKLKFDFAIIKL